MVAVLYASAVQTGLEGAVVQVVRQILHTAASFWHILWMSQDQTIGPCGIFQHVLSFRDSRHFQHISNTTRQPIFSSRQPVISSRQPVISSRQPVISSRQPVISPRQPVFSSRQPVIGSGRISQLCSRHHPFPPLPLLQGVRWGGLPPATTPTPPYGVEKGPNRSKVTCLGSDTQSWALSAIIRRIDNEFIGRHCRLSVID